LLNISAIIPTFNRASLLESALDSVLAQTYPVNEIIVVDDGSTDNTAEVVREKQGRAKLKQIPIHLVQQQQGGAAKARNAGIAASSGDWIAFLDSDDTWLPAKLTFQVDALAKAPATCLACVTDASFANNPDLKRSAFQYAGIDGGDVCRLIDGATKRIAYGYHGMYLQALLMEKRLAMNLGGFDPSFALSEDSDFFLRLSLKTPIVRVNRALVTIDRTPNRENGLLENAKNEAKTFEIQKRLNEKWLDGQLEIDSESKGLMRKRLQEIHSGIASLHLIMGQYEEARISLRRAMKYHMSRKVFSKWILAEISPAIAKALVIKTRENRPHQVLI